MSTNGIYVFPHLVLQVSKQDPLVKARVSLTRVIAKQKQFFIRVLREEPDCVMSQQGSR